MENDQIEKIAGKLILKATITNTSPLIIANGRNDIIDFEVIRDSSGKPFIPASGFAGMLRNSFDKLDKNPTPLNEDLKYFWGAEDNNDPSQSHIIIDDLKINDGYIIREGDSVAINHKTNLGINRNKFDYELLEPGAKFELNSEVTLRNGFNPSSFLEFLYFIAQKGRDGAYQQGAFKSCGSGILMWSNVEIYAFHFPENGADWFRYLRSKGTEHPINVYSKNICQIVSKESNILSIEGEFSINNSLIIRSDVDETKVSEEKSPDKTHLKNSAGHALMTGKSIKGAIRHRAHKILNTIQNPVSDEIIDKLFGYVNERTKKAQPSRVKSFENTIEGANGEQIQPRIKIDRYTSGTIEHALMQSQPLWHKNEMFTLKFEIEECSDFEAGLMLLVMKDLMKEDLPIGGEKAIGRGLLTGSKLTVKGKVSNSQIEIDLKFNGKGITDTKNVDMVNGWVSKLSNAITQ